MLLCCRVLAAINGIFQTSIAKPLICEFHQLIPTRIYVLTGSSNVLIYILLYIWRKFFLIIFSLQLKTSSDSKLHNLFISGWCEPTPPNCSFARHLIGKMVILAAHLLITSKVRRAPRKTETCSPSGSWVEPKKKNKATRLEG